MKLLIVILCLVCLGGCEDEYSPHTVKGQANRAKVEKWAMEMRQKKNEKERQENLKIQEILQKQDIKWEDYKEDSGWNSEPAFTEICPECETATYIHKLREVIIGKRIYLEKCADCGFIGVDTEFSCPEREGKITEVSFEEGSRWFKEQNFEEDHVGYRKDGTSFRRAYAK